MAVLQHPLASPTLEVHHPSSPPRTRIRAASIDANHCNIPSECDSPLNSYISPTSPQATSIFASPMLVRSTARSSSTSAKSNLHLKRTDESVSGGALARLDIHYPDSHVDNSRDLDPDGYDIPHFHVLCLYDFDSEDPDHTSFKKNDILKVIAQEPSGWWAAQTGDHVGWIPSSFVVYIAPEMVQKLLQRAT